ncbi:hypothetical protein FOA26_10255 [Bacillus velezensis]
MGYEYYSKISKFVHKEGLMLKRLRAAYILTEEQFDEMVKPENLKPNI